jgi:hypothetical protein
MIVAGLDRLLRNDTTAKITTFTLPPDIPHRTLSRTSPLQSGTSPDVS